MKATKLNYITLKKETTNFEKVRISRSQDAADYIRNFYSDDIGIFESFFILIMNRKNETIGYAKISQGGTAGTVIDTKIIAKYAVDSLANSLILAHNHPSGYTEPSEQDKIITTKIINAMKLLDVNVLDHVILTENSYRSMADECDVIF